MQKRTKRNLAYGAGLLFFCALFALNDYQAVVSAKAQADAQRRAGAGGGDGDANSPSKSSKSSTRASAPKPASDKEAEKFRRFFLPPLKLQNATIEEAVAAILAAYNETAAATGEPALDLRVDTASALTRKPITCTTPRAPAGTVLRYVAAMAGNRTKGSLPNFRLEALSDQADRKGKMDVPPDWASQVADLLTAGTKASEAKLAEDPFAKSAKEDSARDDPFSGSPPSPRLNLRDLLVAQGFNPELVCTQSGTNFSYENMSEAEQELLAALAEAGGLGGLGPVQLKTNAKVLTVPDSVAGLLNTGAALTDGEVQLSMREFAQTKGVDLMTLPSITARVGQDAMIEIINTTPTQDGGETWTGVKLATIAVPYGLGSQVEFALKSREEDGSESLAREQVTLPENASGVALSQTNGGQKLVVMVGNTMIDATGRPLAPQP